MREHSDFLSPSSSGNGLLNRLEISYVPLEDFGTRSVYIVKSVGAIDAFLDDAESPSVGIVYFGCIQPETNASHYVESVVLTRYYRQCIN